MSEVAKDGTETDWIIDLEHLPESCPALSVSHLRSLAEAAAVCLDERGHLSGVRMKVAASVMGSARIIFQGTSDSMRRTYNDTDEATEWGACAVAIALIRELTPHAVIRRSRRGTGFDYWLGDDGVLPFQDKARLEISGLRSAKEAKLNARVKKKLEQTKQSDGFLPAYVIVVEFQRPEARVVQR